MNHYFIESPLLNVYIIELQMDYSVIVLIFLSLPECKTQVTIRQLFFLWKKYFYTYYNLYSTIRKKNDNFLQVSGSNKYMLFFIKQENAVLRTILLIRNYSNVKFTYLVDNICISGDGGEGTYKLKINGNCSLECNVQGKSLKISFVIVHHDCLEKYRMEFEAFKTDNKINQTR
ncbi:hypothetical protein AGLY_000709 [Aphis glycines]|uniref:Uncharacterized protein n=1 Tax=Aphis glycines TaxID=307491 RepID=A0A6G0UAA3_APHGL|nr:hypothetical protein AGLY_000709 [Aphis glycines]